MQVSKSKLSYYLLYVLIFIFVLLLAANITSLTINNLSDPKNNLNMIINHSDSLFSLKKNSYEKLNLDEYTILNFLNFQCRNCIERYKNWDDWYEDLKNNENVKFYHIIPEINENYAKLILKNISDESDFDVYLDDNYVNNNNFITRSSSLLFHNGKLISNNFNDFKNFINNK